VHFNSGLLFSALIYLAEYDTIVVCDTCTFY